MSELRGWFIYSWIALPTVMYGGYALLRLLTKANALTPFRLPGFARVTLMPVCFY